MKIVETIDDANNDEYNYYITQTKQFMFRKYKTRPRYGVQVFDVPAKLSDMIEEHIVTEKLNNGDMLFVYHSGKKSKDGFCDITFHNKVVDTFGTPANGLRHSYISYLYKNPNNLFNIRDTSNKMAHSVATHLNYLDRKQFQ